MTEADRQMPHKEWYYKVYLKSPEWQALKQEISEKYEHKCACCGSNEKLNVHHLFYRDYDNNEKDDDYNLILLCEKCHLYFHKVKKSEEEKVKQYEENIIAEFEALAKKFVVESITQLQVIQAESAVTALQGNKTKYLAKLQSYFTFPPVAAFKRALNMAIGKMEPKKKNTMQYISELRIKKKSVVKDSLTTENEKDGTLVMRGTS